MTKVNTCAREMYPYSVLHLFPPFLIYPIVVAGTNRSVCSFSAVSYVTWYYCIVQNKKGPNMDPHCFIYTMNQIHRGSYMSAQVLLNLLNELGKRYKMRGLPSILSIF